MKLKLIVPALILAAIATGLLLRRAQEHSVQSQRDYVISLALNKAKHHEMGSTTPPSWNVDKSTTNEVSGERTVITPSPWNVGKSTNTLSGELTVTASNGYGQEGLVIRRIGKNLECYVNTGKFLETVQTMHNGGSVVKYKFDNGAVVSQTWQISSDHEGLFYPGNPSGFLKRMSQAKRLVIEYKPADTVPETISFDVSQFPAEFTTAAQPAPPAHQPSQEMCVVWQAEYNAGIQDAGAANVVLDKLISHHCPGEE